MKLHLGHGLSLPIEAVTMTFAILAKRGVGKTYTGSIMAEEMLKARQPIVALDPTGAWWGLRSGFPIAVFGGEHADIPLEENAGEVIASAIVENGFSAVIDLSLFRKGQAIRFMVAFAETLYRANRNPIHLFVDEADAFAPQGRNYGGEENRMLGAMEDLVRRGRKRGIGCTLITQRAAVINKNVLTQCENLFLMRMTHPRDISAAKEWIDVHADPAQAGEVVKSLPSLPVGECWFWSPGWMGMLERVKIRARETFDSGATPKPGERVKAPKDLAEIDLASLGEQIKATVEKAKENDPRELRRQLADLQKQLRERSAAQATIERVEVPVLKNGQLDKATNLVSRLDSAITKEETRLASLKEIANGLRGAIATAAKPTLQASPARHSPTTQIHQARPILAHQNTNHEATATKGKPQGGLRRMMTALAQRPGLSAKQLGVRAGLSSSSGTFGTYLGGARSNGWVEGSRDRLELTDFGLAALGEFMPLPEGQSLLAYWLSSREIGGGAARMLETLAAIYPNALSAGELGERAGLSAGSGTFGTYLGKLRTLELVSGGRDALRASDELF